MVRILIIDDDDTVRVMVRKMLEYAGYDKAEEADDGSEGVKVFRQDPFDLVITDIVMPGKDGLETIIELSRDYPGTKIIAMSGGDDSQDHLERAKYLGANRTLSKPFNSSGLIDVVKEVLNE